MRIAIDARMMSPLRTRGIGRYVEELVRALVAERSGHTYVLLTHHPETSPFLGQPGVEHIAADIPWYGLAEQTRLPRLIRHARVDLLHVPHWNVPLAWRGPLVVTIHDLLLRHQPSSAKASTRHPLYAATKYWAYRGLLRDVTGRARRLLVPTRFVADEIRQFYPRASDRVSVTGEGLTDLPSPDLRRVPPGPFLFYVGSAYPHKRLDLLLRAWSVVSRERPGLELVIAGEEDLFMARVVAEAKARNLPRVVFPGRVTDAELAALLDHAAAFVFPSSHEGFGLPPLEALTHGCPVVASDIPALREVLPERGVIFFGSGDADGMIRAINTALTERTELSEGARAALAGIRERHDWQKVAERTREAYDRVVRP